MSDYQTLLLQQESHIARVMLNRPECLNAINSEMLAEMRDLFPKLAADRNVRVVVLAAQGKGFSAGADVMSGLAPGSKPDVEAALNEEYKPALMALTAMEKPVIAEVQGACAGVGSAFALTCDLIVMSETAYMLQAFVNIGLLPDGGNTWLLPHLCGYHRAYQIAVEGERIPAQVCLELGLANHVVPGDELTAFTMEWADRLARKAPRSLALTKRAMRQAYAAVQSEVISTEAGLQQELVQTRDAMEGIMAFMQKREPNFSGE